MNNKKQIKQPVFAEVNLTGDEFQKSPSSHMQRTRFLKLVYPNDVTLILPGDISASQLERNCSVKSCEAHRSIPATRPMLCEESSKPTSIIHLHP